MTLLLTLVLLIPQPHKISKCGGQVVASSWHYTPLKTKIWRILKFIPKKIV